jgi:hypothetical protein
MRCTGGKCLCGSDPAEYWENPEGGTSLTFAANRDALRAIGPRTVSSKLVEWDANSDAAFEELLTWIQGNRDELLAIAKGRHVWGHYRYADRNYYEYDADRLVSETAEEIGDAINYFTRRRVLRES